MKTFLGVMICLFIASAFAWIAANRVSTKIARVVEEGKRIEVVERLTGYEIILEGGR